MGTFPTKILLATDGSEEATLAAGTAVELAKSTGSELHVVHVGEFVATFFAQTEIEPAQVERAAHNLLDEQVKKIEGAGGTVTEAYRSKPLGDPLVDRHPRNHCCDKREHRGESRGQGRHHRTGTEPRQSPADAKNRGACEQT